MNPFLEACGAEGPLQLDVKGNDRSMIGRWTLDKPYALVGRDPRVDLVLSHEQVSRRHAYVQVIAGRAFCIDLGSRSGVILESGREGSGWFDRGQGMGVGPFTVQLRGGAGGERIGSAVDIDPLSEQSAGAGHRPGVILQFRGQWSCPIRRTLTLVGTARACKLRLKGPNISKYHCSLVHTREGMWVVDLAAREGIVVNGKAVTAARLGEGDVLGVGGYQFDIHSEKVTPGAHSGLPAVRVPDRSSIARALVPLENDRLADRGLAVSGHEQATVSPWMIDQMARMQEQMLNVMQQQISDQFQQMIQVIGRMLGTMHRDQTDLIREEFERLHELNQEIQSLNAKAVSSPPRSRVNPAVVATGPLPPPLPIPADDTGDDDHAWIHTRLGTLHRERQNRWQHLLDLVMGRPGEIAGP